MDVPALVRQRALASGTAGRDWLAGLDELVADLERRWSVQAGPALPGGSAAYVARARTSDGRTVVLKVVPPDPELRLAEQARTLAAARGRGYALLLASDLERSALLLEALGPPLSRSGLAPERQLETLCTVLARAWLVPRPDGAALQQAQGKAAVLAELVSSLWEDLGRPCSERVVALALEHAERRRAGTDLQHAVVVHGDPHPDNALRVLQPRPGAEGGYVLVDPDGFLADPAYDLGVALRGWCAQLLAGDADHALATARRYCARLAATSGLDPTAIWEWGFLERVSSGLHLLQLGAEDEARAYLESAERLVAARACTPSPTA